jgi:hypothetical protein
MVKKHLEESTALRMLCEINGLDSVDHGISLIL